MKIPLLELRHAVALVLVSGPFTAFAESSDVSVVLVHGAFSDGSAWHKVIPILQDAGVPVSAAQMPLSSLADDAAVVSRLIERQDGSVVLVGHSYGGNVITETGSHDKVEALVYVAGFALDAGQALADLSEGEPPAPWQSEAIADAEGFIRLSDRGIAQFFAPDLPADEVAVIAATQGPFQYKITYEAPSVAAWSIRPTYYVLAENDQIIPPRLQGYFAERIGAEITTIASSHVAMLSQPEAVAEVILGAVETIAQD
ncbi:MAG: alpha/beta hydrolase [Pseudomonadota bacterium]